MIVNVVVHSIIFFFVGVLGSIAYFTFTESTLNFKK